VVVTARDVMTPTDFLREADSLADAAVMMRDLDVSSIPVCNGDGRLAGMLSDRDIVVRCLAAGWDPYATSSRELVDAHAVVVSVDDPVQSALLTMVINRVHEAPVVDGGSLVGMLADTDLAQSLPDHALGVLMKPRHRSAP
jgi:CBS domain-containing protein